MTQERREGIRADLLVRTPIGTYNQFFILDFTCATIHSDSNIQYAFKKLETTVLMYTKEGSLTTQKTRKILSTLNGIILKEAVMRPPARVLNTLFPLLVTLEVELVRMQ